MSGRAPALIGHVGTETYRGEGERGEIIKIQKQASAGFQ